MRAGCILTLSEQVAEAEDLEPLREKIVKALLELEFLRAHHAIVEHEVMELRERVKK